jgi:hypothetical protein
MCSAREDKNRGKNMGILGAILGTLIVLAVLFIWVYLAEKGKI